MILPTQEQTPPTPPPYNKPLTDPVDLLTLLGRAVICLVLGALTIALLIRQVFGFALFVGIISIIVQRMTYKLWKRLRDERMAAQAALSAEGKWNRPERKPHAMISPSTQTRQGTPRFFLNLLRVYVVRHVIGIGLFLILMNMAWHTARPFTWILSALLLAYAGYAVYGTRKIHKMYQASARRAQAQEGG